MQEILTNQYSKKKYDNVVHIRENAMCYVLLGICFILFIYVYFFTHKIFKFMYPFLLFLKK